jgi:ABC-type uncharacterized transport system substrate-binding protein
MKEIKTYADQYGKYYEVKSYEYAKKLYSYEDANNYYKNWDPKYYISIDYTESEEERIAREAREKAIRINERIDYVLNKQDEI